MHARANQEERNRTKCEWQNRSESGPCRGRGIFQVENAQMCESKSEKQKAKKQKTENYRKSKTQKQEEEEEKGANKLLSTGNLGFVGSLLWEERWSAC